MMAGSFNHDDDPNTTNLFIGNINPTVNESDLCDVFAAYGPLASVKIMWPRTDEERARNRNNGFVAYMSRQDAEKALKSLIGSSIRNYDLRLGWAKQVAIPPMPIALPDSRRIENAEALLFRPILDSVPLPMTHCTRYSASQPASSKPGSKANLLDFKIEKKDKLDKYEIEELDRLLNKLDTKRKSIGDCMLYCINHSYAAQDVIERIYKSIAGLVNSSSSLQSGDSTFRITQILAKIYLISDILHNCSAQVPNASYYRGGFKSKLRDIFGHTAEGFARAPDASKLTESKERILTVFKAWKDWTLYEDEFLVELSGIALGIEGQKSDHAVGIANLKDGNSIFNIDDNRSISQDDLDGIIISQGELEQCLESKGLTLDWYRSLGLMMDELDSIYGATVGAQQQPVVHIGGGNFDEVDFPRPREKTVTFNDNCKSQSIAKQQTSIPRPQDTDEWKAKRAAFKTTKWDTIEPEEYNSDDHNTHVTSLSDYHDIADTQEEGVSAGQGVDKSQLSSDHQSSMQHVSGHADNGLGLVKRGGCDEDLESAAKKARVEPKEEGEIDASSDESGGDPTSDTK